MTKIDIYSGFLGAGKTTLIKKMIQEAYAGQKLVLIENEFGEIGIDGGFMQECGIQVNEMNSGCICCSLVGDFGKALTQVVEQYHPDRILIEPSGVGKLSDVAAAVERVKDAELEIGSLITVVDANKIKVYMKNFGEFYANQVESASVIVLSRTGSIAPQKLETGLAILREHNPKARIITTDWAQITGDQILAASEEENSLTKELTSMLEDAHAHHHHHDHDEHCGCGCHDHEHEHEHHHDHEEEDCCHHHDHEHEHEHHHDHDENCTCGCHDHEHHHDHHGHHHADEVFQSWGVETPRKYTAQEIHDILVRLDDDEAFGVVLRAKGIVEAQDGSWIHFDFVPGEAQVRQGPAAVTGRLCVIGSKLRESAITELFGVGA